MTTKPTLLVALALLGCDSNVMLPPLDPPPDGQGFQLKTQPLTLSAGSENQDCYFFRVPAPSDVYVNRIVMRQTTGSHHMNIFRVRTVVNLSGDDGTVIHGGNDRKNPCWVSSNWADWPLVVNTQSSQPGKETVEFDLPDGVAHHFQAGELLMLQTHYVNATTQQTPGDAMVWVNFNYLPAAQVKAELGTLFATDQNIMACPGQASFTKATCAIPQAVTVVAANGHFHSRGTRFQMDVFTSQGGDGPAFYDNSSWNDPTMATGLSVQVPAMGSISYRCDYFVPADECGDPNKNCCFGFGPSVETNEHCNAFVYYYPKGPSDIRCF